MKLIKKILQFTMISLLILACQNENESVKQNNFQDSLDLTVQKLHILNIEKDESFFSKRESKTLYLSHENDVIINDTNFLESINTIQNLISSAKENNLDIKESIDADDIVLEDYYISEEEILETLQPSIQQAKEILYTKGYTEIEIQDLLTETNTEEAHLIPTIMLLTASDKEDRFLLNQYQGKFDVDKAIDCAIAAVGLNLFDIVRNVSEEGFKAALKATLRGIGTKFLGPIGVAITVAEWAVCYAY